MSKEVHIRAWSSFDAREAWRAREKRHRGEASREKAKEHPWVNLTKGRSGISGSAIPSDWSILTGVVNIRALLMQMRNAIWRWSV